jgi:hypothetical protein
MMSHVTAKHPRTRPIRLALAGLLTLMLSPVGALAADSSFSLSGDLDIEVSEADASPIKIRSKIPAIKVISTPAMIKQLGKTYSVNLFLPDGFQAAPGTYPIAFAYRGNPDTLGASVVAAGKLLSHDTQGQAEFSDEGTRVRVVFSFGVASASEGSADRQAVTVEGEALFDRAQMADLY